VPLVLVLLVLEELDLPIWALVRTYSPADDELGVEVAVPDVPVVLLLLPFWRQPVSVMFPLVELWLLDVPLVCAAIATGKATTTNATTHICLFMLCLLHNPDGCPAIRAPH